VILIAVHLKQEKTFITKMELRNMAGLISAIIVLLGFLQTTTCQDLKFHGIHEMKQQTTGSEPLTLLWGIADTTAYVGKLFTYTLPNDAFQGNIIHYDVSI